MADPGIIGSTRQAATPAQLVDRRDANPVAGPACRSDLALA